MAIEITSNYAGEVLDQLMVRATTQNDIVNKGLVRVEPNISYKFFIPRLRMDGKVLQKRKEQPKDTDSKGDLKIDEKVLEPKEFMAFTTFNPRSFEKIWRKWQPTGELVFAELPSSVQNQLLAELAKVVDFELGWHFVNGTHGSSDMELFDGFLHRIRTDTNTIKIATAYILTVENIIAQLRKIYDKIPSHLRGKKGLRILMSIQDFDKYDDALSALPNKGASYTDVNVKRFKGVTIDTISDMPENTIVTTVTGTDLNTNLWVGIADAKDQTTIKIGLLENAGERYFFKMLMKADTNIAFGEEVVFYDGADAVAEPAPESTPEPSVVLSASQLSFPKSASTKQVSVEATCPYTVSGEVDGFTYVTEENLLKITAAPNVGDQRGGELSVALESHPGIVATLSLTQAKGN